VSAPFGQLRSWPAMMATKMPLVERAYPSGQQLLMGDGLTSWRHVSIMPTRLSTGGGDRHVLDARRVVHRDLLL
jgi:hypothetical protein